jgi:solute carrier family 50 protein (sugar transporter)
MNKSLKMAYGTVVKGAMAAAVQTSPAWVAACGKAAPLVSSGVFLSPLPTVQNIIREKSVGNLPLLPYSSMCVNSFVWMTYGKSCHPLDIVVC